MKYTAFANVNSLKHTVVNDFLTFVLDRELKREIFRAEVYQH